MARPAFTKPNFPYQAQAVRDADGRLADVAIVYPDKTWHAFGKAGVERERRAAARAVASGKAVLFVGAGLGEGVAACLESGTVFPVAVVDRQEPLYSLTGTRARFEADPRVAWIGADDPGAAAKAVSAWLRRLGFPEVEVVIDPATARLDPEMAQAVRRRVEDLGSPYLRQAFGCPRFASGSPRILMLDSGYFLCREIRSACEPLGYPLATVPTAAVRGNSSFVEAFLGTAQDFRPDFVITVNHLGLDREGAFMALLERLRLPLASWFVDSPRLILHDHAELASPWAMIFTWDKGALPELDRFGFAHARYLPLATDETRFRPDPQASASPWRSRVSFVGDSMNEPVARSLHNLAAHPTLTRAYRDLAREFAASPAREARDFLQLSHPDVHQAYLDLPDDQARLDFEMLLTWEAARQYRLERVSQLMNFSPLIVGDAGWKKVLPGAGKTWRWHGPVNYYDDLPRLYPASEINFNCTSPQMKGAVNQRVFDVPACGAFVLTDDRQQLHDLFKPGREVATYDDPAAIPSLVRRYLDHPAERQAIAQAGRARVLAQHTYVHRLREMAQAMRETFGG